MSNVDQLSLPSAYVRHVLTLTSEQGIPQSEVLGDIPLHMERHSRQENRISLADTAAILQRALTAYGPELGYDVGLKVRLTNHGLFAYGLMAMANGRDVLEYGIHFMPLSIPHLSMSYHCNEHHCQIKIRETVPLGPFRQYSIDSFLVGLSLFFEQLLAEMPSVERQLSLNFESPEPSHFLHYKDRLPPCHFNATFNGLVIPATALDAAMNTSDPDTARTVRQQCETALLLQGTTERSTVERVRGLFEASETRFPSLLQAAEALHLSERSLKRKLQQQGFSYQQLLDQARCEKAKTLLRNPHLNLADIADLLGYASATGFTRAFRQWAGITPSGYRICQQTNPDASG